MILPLRSLIALVAHFAQPKCPSKSQKQMVHNTEAIKHRSDNA